MNTYKIISKLLYGNWLELRSQLLSLLPISKKQKDYLRFKHYFHKLAHKAEVKRNTFHYLFGKHATAVLYNTSNGLLLSAPNDITIGEKLGFLGGYDLEKIIKLRTHVNEFDIVYVIGAHIGSLVIPLSETVSRVIAFEPNPTSYRLLQYNAKLNSVNNIDLFQLGTYEEDGKKRFLQNKANSGGSKILPRHLLPIYNYDNPEEIEIEVVGLDSFIAKANLPLPTIICMDVEGAEYASLLGSTNCLSQVRSLYIEFVPHHLDHVSNVTVGQFVSLISPFFKKATITDTGYSCDIRLLQELLSQYYHSGSACDILLEK